MSKAISIKDKVVLISGSNRGIGKAILKEFIARGAAKVYAGARNTDSLKEVAEELGEKVVPLQLDVTSEESVKAAGEVVSDVDILINNAGVFSVARAVGENYLESLNENFQVNVYGLSRLTNAFIDGLKSKEQAAVVNVLSVVGLASMPFGASYCASKAAAHSLTQGLRGDMEESNVLVAGVYPGPIDTDMTKDVEMEKESPENVAKAVANGVEAGDEYIFPDPMAVQVGQGYLKSPVEIEKMFFAYK